MDFGLAFVGRGGKEESKWKGALNAFLLKGNNSMPKAKGKEGKQLPSWGCFPIPISSKYNFCSVKSKAKPYQPK